MEAVTMRNFFLTGILMVFMFTTVVMAEELETAACVQKPDSFRGVIISKIVSDHHQKGRKWCYVFTADNTLNAWLDELEAISCAQAVENFTKARKRKLFQWLGGGSNPMFNDTVERSQ